MAFNEWHTVADVASRLSVHPESVRRWIRESRLNAVLIGRRWRVSESALLNFIVKQQRHAMPSGDVSSYL